MKCTKQNTHSDTTCICLRIKIDAHRNFFFKYNDLISPATFANSALPSPTERTNKTRAARDRKRDDRNGQSSWTLQPRADENTRVILEIPSKLKKHIIYTGARTYLIATEELPSFALNFYFWTERRPFAAANEILAVSEWPRRPHTGRWYHNSGRVNAMGSFLEKTSGNERFVIVPRFSFPLPFVAQPIHGAT